MGIKYTHAPELREVARGIVELLGWNHILLEHVSFLRSFGSSSRGTIARCHSLGKAMQMGMGRIKGFYLIEVISERFDKLSEREKIETLIHELMHIPKTFGGGFVHHDRVHDESVKKVYDHYCNLKNKGSVNRWF
ncbi:MAG: putative metallopeptidase [Nanoarchaeota archaeon]|nr:putative metallopeptidase [Nanoarchaeota archaeon]